MNAKVRMSDQPIVLQVDNIFTDIVGYLPSDKKSALEKLMSFRPEGYMFSPAYQKWIYTKDGKKVRRAWDGWKKQFWSNKSRTYFPTGLYSIAQQFLKENNINHLVQDLREKPESNFNLEFSEDFKLRDFQQKVADDACEISRGLISISTGGGKTPVAAGIIKQLAVSPFMFFVTSIDLLDQAKESFQKFLRFNGSPLQVGQIGNGVVDIKDVNVCTVQTAVRALGERYQKFDDEEENLNKKLEESLIEKHRPEILDLLKSAKGYASDEVHHWKSEICQLVDRSLVSAYYRFGLSATVNRDAGDDLLIQACFGKIISKITATELIDKGWLIAPDIKIIHINNRKSKFRTWDAIYKDRVVECPYYNGIITNIANAFINDNRTVLVLSKQIDHGEKLAAQIEGSKYFSGKSTKEQRKKGLFALKNREIRAISSSIIFDEGIDLPILDTLLLASQGKSKTRAMQRIGRITRPYDGPLGKKTKATAIDFWIHDRYLEDHAKAREKMYRTEPGYKIEHLEA